MSLEFKLFYENHEDLGCIWRYGTEYASIILNCKPTERQLRKLRRVALATLPPIHHSAVAMEQEINNG